MNRLFGVFTAGLVVLVGCGKDEKPIVSECDYEDLDLSACDKSGLGAVQAEGIWNMNLVFSDGDMSPAVMRFSGQAQISGLPITETRVEPERFQLSSQVTADGVPVSYLFAGCRAPTPTQLQGVFRRCVQGKKDLEGSFDAARLMRREGEAEGSRVEFVSEIALPEESSARDVFVHQGYAYVAAHEAGLFIYDVSNPRAPALMARRGPEKGESWNQVWVREQTLYVASSKRGVMVFDLTDPKSPTAVGVVATGANVTAMTFDGSRLYAASPSPNAEVLILDATVARSPVITRRYYVEQSNPILGDLPWDVAVQDNRLYVSHGTYGLTISDVSDPSKPTLLGNFEYSGGYTRMAAVVRSGNATVAFEAGEGWDAHLRVLDVTAPKVVTQMSEFKLRPEASISAMAVAGTRLYLGHYQDGLRILDVSNPNAVQPVGYFNTWRESDPGRGSTFFEGVSDVAVPGDGYIYVAETSRGLLILREQP
jgi:hypothetical protein